MLMDDRIVRDIGLHTGRHRMPQEEGLGSLDLEVGLFQTAKGAAIKILRSQVVPRHPELIFDTLYGTNRLVENGREGGRGTTCGRLFIEGEMARRER